MTVRVDILLSSLFFSIYAIVAVVIGIIASRKESEDDFMIADRKVSGIQMVATITAGLFDGAALSIYIAYVYQFGFSAIWFFLGMSLGFILFRHFSARIKRRADELGVYSMPEYFFRLIGPRTGGMFSLFLGVQFFVYLVVNFIISGKVLAQIFPMLSYGSSVVVGGLVILTYLLMGGFKAVVRTDLYQFLIMILMSLSVGYFLWGASAVSGREFDLVGMGFGNIASFLILAGLGVLVAPDLWQRVFAARDVRTLKSGFGYGAFILPVLAIVVTTVGLATRKLFPGLEPEDALVVGFAELLPYGVREFGLVLLYAVALSSSDTVAFVVSSIVTRDMKNYTKRFEDESMKRMTRFFMVFFVLSAMSVAVLYQRILPLAFSLLSLNIALFPVVFGSFFWKVKEAAAFWSLVLALASIVILSAVGSLSPATATLSLPVSLVSLLVFQRLFGRPSALPTPRRL